MILFETANQFAVLFFCAVFGFCSGLFFDLGGILCFLSKNNKILRFFCDFFAVLLCFFVIFLICYKLNYGQFRLYIPLIFSAFCILERITLGKLVAKGYERCYTLFIKFSQRIIKVFNKKDGKTKEKK